MHKFIATTLFLFLNYFASVFAQSSPPRLDNIQQELEKVLESGHCPGSHHLHTSTHIDKVQIANSILEVYLHTHQPIDDFNYDLLLESFLPAVSEYGLKDLKIMNSDEHGNYVDLEKVFSKESVPIYDAPKNTDPFEAIKGEQDEKGSNPHLGQTLASGSLDNKTVWISPGHGWLWNSGLNDYLTQRGNTNGMVEDFGSVENVNQYFQQYLMNAGANVWSVRERDMNSEEVIVDNDNGAPSYTETGTWSTSGSTGYNGGTYRFATSSTIETAAATYTPDIPKAGWYWISAYYREGPNRSIDTQYKINHAGGQTLVSINQEVHGQTWVYLGQFYFEEGMNGNVILSNETTDPSGAQAIISDAIRFGGGVGDLNDCANAGSPVSGKSRYDECARQFARYQGYNTCESDVVTRPHYAEWELSKGTTTEQNNAVYVSLHSNAFNGSARGTETYMYNGTATPNSDVLRNLIHAELIDDITNGWDSNWNDRGTKEANFGEIRELTTMPGTLVELAFHDNVTDADAMKTPYFRNLAARAMYKGIVRFFNQVDGSPLDFLPEPPDHLIAYNSAQGEITLEWDAPAFGGILGDAATGYKVYYGTHGYGFVDGVAISGTAATLTNVLPNTTYYFQVTATNAGGESFPTATIAARTPTSGSEVPLLIVDGFDRLDRASNVDVFESSALGTVERTIIEQMNGYDYVVPHARSIGSCNIPFDGASNEAVIAGDILLTDYEGVDWITGEESTVDRTFDDTEQTLVTTFLDAGGKIIVSGAEIGWDIGRSSSPNTAVSFYNNYLKTTYQGDDGATYDFTGIAAGIFDGINGSFDDGSDCEYNAEFPDRLGATGGSSVVLNYSGGTNDGAAIAYNGIDFGVVNFGFPLETITDDAVRDALLCNALDYLEVEATNCPTVIIENRIPIPDGTIHAGETILSAGLVPANGNVEMKAGVEIILQPNFEVELNSNFKAEIEGCN